MKTKDDNMTIGKLVLWLGIIVLVVWLVKVVLFFLLDLAASVLTVSFYVVIIYAIIIFTLSLYAHLSPDKTPKLVKFALMLNHGIAVALKAIFSFFKKLFDKR